MAKPNTLNTHSSRCLQKSDKKKKCCLNTSHQKGGHMFCSFEISLLAIHSCPMMQAPSAALITVKLGQALHRCPYWYISKQYNSSIRNNICMKQLLALATFCSKYNRRKMDRELIFFLRHRLMSASRLRG